MDDFENYTIAIDVDCDSEDVIFTGYVYKINTPLFNRVKRSHYGRGTNFRQYFVEYISNNCYIPASGNCFIKCIKYFTKKDNTEKFLSFTRTEKNRSGLTISARIQPFCRKYNINIGCFNGNEITPRNNVEGNTALFIHNIRFCLIWKSNSISFNEAAKDELKPHFKVIDNVISDKYVRSFVEYEYEHKKFLIY